jgi:hypothetical protein
MNGLDGIEGWFGSGPGFKLGSQGVEVEIRVEKAIGF